MNMPYFCRNFFLTDWRHKRLKNTIDLCYFTENTSTDFRKVKCWNSLLRQINFHELPKYFSNFQMLTLISKFQNWKIFLMKNSQKLGTLFSLLARQFEKWHVFGTLARLLAGWHVGTWKWNFGTLLAYWHVDTLTTLVHMARMARDLANSHSY